MTISTDRNQDISIKYWLETVVPASVAVLDAFPTNQQGTNQQLILPSVSIETSPMEGYPFELGNRTERTSKMWAIDIYAKNKVQRDELVYLIFNELDCGIPVQDYNGGFPPSVVPSGIGRLVTSNKRATPIYVFADLIEDLYWRSEITFTTEYYPNT